MTAKAPPPAVLAAMARLNDRLAGQEAGIDAATAQDWPETFRVQMEAALHDQAELLDETQKMMAAWTKRRHEAMEAGFRTLQKLSDSKDVGEMAAAYGEWLTNSMGRIMTDMMAAHDGALRLANLGQSALTSPLSKGAVARAPAAGDKKSKPG